MNDNSLSGGSSAVGSVPVTINAGGVLTGSDTADGGVGASAHIRGLLTLNGGTLANGGTGAQPQWGTWNLDDGVVVNGGTNTSTMSALDIIPTQAGGTIFSVTNGGTTSGVDLDVTGTLINGTSMPDTGIILNGNGTMVLAGANTYAGPTIVSNGTLLVNGSTSTGAVTVEGGTLGGTGTIGGAVMVNSGGSLAPQNLGAGTLAINGNITLNVGSTSTFAVNGSTTANDAVAAGGTVAYGGVLNIVTNGSFSLGQTFTLFSGSGAASASSFSSIAGSPGSGLAFAFTNGVLSVVSAFTPSANNLLTCLAVNPPAGILSGFVSNTMTYSVTNYLPNNPVTVTVTNADPTATNTLFFNTVNEGALASTGATSGALTLTQGAANVLQVQVVSQSGATNTYTVNVTLQPNQSAFKLSNSVSGTTLTLSWPADHLGYRLLVQTNNLNKGVSANISDWGTVAGSTTNTSMSIQIIKATNNAYYRLVNP
jgi:autotransporter-associated beta strand protein